MVLDLRASVQRCVLAADGAGSDDVVFSGDGGVSVRAKVEKACEFGGARDVQGVLVELAEADAQ